MIISNSKKFVFIHIHKTGGTSIATALEKTLQWNDLMLGVTRHGKLIEALMREKNGLKKHSHSTEIRKVIGEDLWKSYFTFAFVRNPYDRIVSLYNWLETTANRSRAKRHLRYILPNHEPWSWPGMKAYTETRNFSEFIRHEQFSKHAPGAKTMFDWLSEDGELIVDFVGRVESMEEDFSNVCTSIRCEKLTLPKLNISKGVKTLEEYYKDQEDLDLIYERYRCDFDTFGYERL